MTSSDRCRSRLRIESDCASCSRWPVAALFSQRFRSFFLRKGSGCVIERSPKHRGDRRRSSSQPIRFDRWTRSSYARRDADLVAHFEKRVEAMGGKAIAIRLEKHSTVCDMLYGFKWAKWSTGTPAERLSLIPAGQEQILEQDDGKNRFVTPGHGPFAGIRFVCC